MLIVTLMLKLRRASMQNDKGLYNDKCAPVMNKSNVFFTQRQPKSFFEWPIHGSRSLQRKETKQKKILESYYCSTLNYCYLIFKRTKQVLEKVITFIFIHVMHILFNWRNCCYHTNKVYNVTYPEPTLKHNKKLPYSFQIQASVPPQDRPLDDRCAQKHPPGRRPASLTPSNS